MSRSSILSAVLALSLAVLLAGCGGSGSSADAGNTNELSSDAGVQGNPITAPVNTWTWVDFPDSACGNGAATGIGVNLSSKSKDVLVYMEGGGACWDYATCFVYNTAANMATGFTKAEFDQLPLASEAIVDRTDPENPFKDASFIFIPYCTGDIFAGDAVRTYDSTKPDKKAFHKGAANMDAFLKRLTATFPQAGKIWLSGSSAGGYGAQFNYARYAAAFPAAEVHALADCSPLVPAVGGRYAAWLQAWNVTIPPACTNCATEPAALLSWLSTSYPNRRFGLLDYRSDGVIRQYFGYSTSGTDFETATDALLTSHYDPSSNARYFQLAGSQHVMVGGFDHISQPNGGIALKAWISRWANGDSSWASVK